MEFGSRSAPSTYAWQDIDPNDQGEHRPGILTYSITTLHIITFITVLIIIAYN